MAEPYKFLNGRPVRLLKSGTWEPLPSSTDDSGQEVFNLDGKAYSIHDLKAGVPKKKEEDARTKLLKEVDLTRIPEAVKGIQEKYGGLSSAKREQELRDISQRQFDNLDLFAQLKLDKGRAVDRLFSKKRQSLTSPAVPSAGVSIDDIFNDPTNPKPYKDLLFNLTLTNTVHAGRAIPKALVKTVGDLGGSVVAGAMRIPEAYHKAKGDSAETKKERVEEYRKAKDLLEGAQGVVGTGDRWAKWLDDRMPMQGVEEYAPFQAPIDSAAAAAPLVAALLTTRNASPLIRARLGTALVGQSASTGFNSATAAGAAPGDAFKNAVGQASIQAIGNRLPLSNIVHKAATKKGAGDTLARLLGTSVEAPVMTASQNLAEHRMTKDATGKELTIPDLFQGLGSNAVMGFGLGKMLHSDANKKQIIADATAAAEDYISRRGSITPEIVQRLYDNAAANVFNRTGELAQPRNFAEMLARLDTDPLIQNETMLDHKLEIPAQPVPRFFDKGIPGLWNRKPQAGRKDLGLQRQIQADQGATQSDMVVTDRWIQDILGNDGNSGNISKFVNDWMTKAARNYDLGYDPLNPNGKELPAQGRSMPTTRDPKTQAALDKRLEFGRAATTDFRRKDIVRTLASQLAGEDLPTIQKLLETGDFSSIKNPAAFADAIVGMRHDLNPYYEPTIYGKSAENVPVPDPKLKTTSDRDLRRRFKYGVSASDDADPGQLYYITDDGNLKPVSRVKTPDGYVTRYGKAVSPEGIKLVSPTNEELRLNAGLEANTDTFKNIAKARLESRKTARTSSLALALSADPDLIDRSEGAPGSSRTPRIKTDDPTLQALFSGDDTKLRNDASNVLENFFGDKKGGKTGRIAEAANRFMDLYTRLSLYNPILHGGNIFEHAAKGVGGRDMLTGDPVEIPALMEHTGQSRANQDLMYQLFRSTGGSDLTAPRGNAAAAKRIGVTDSIRGASDTQDLNLDPTGLEKHLANSSDAVIWGPDANARFGMWLRKIQHGMNPVEAHLALSQVQPNYKIPVNLLDESGPHGRNAGKSFINDAWRAATIQGNKSPDAQAFARLIAPMFSRYRNNSLASTINTARDLTGNVGKGLDKTAMLALLNAGPYQAAGEGLTQLFGDDDRGYNFAKPGSSHYLKLLKETHEGGIGIPQLVDRLYTAPPLARSLYSNVTGRDPMSGRNVEGEQLAYLLEAATPQGYTMTNMARTGDWKGFLATSLLGRRDTTAAEKSASYQSGKKVQPEDVAAGPVDSFVAKVKKTMARDKFKSLLKEGDREGIFDLMKEGNMSTSKRSMNNTINKTFQSRPGELAEKLDSLGEKEALDVFHVMNDWEKAHAGMVVYKKLVSGGTPNELELKLGSTAKDVLKETIAAMERLSLSPYAGKNAPPRKHQEGRTKLGKKKEKK
jgi:hypothetical protein